MEQTEYTTVELLEIYKALMERMDECKNGQDLDELEKSISDFEEWYPQIVAEYYVINRLV